MKRNYSYNSYDKPIMEAPSYLFDLFEIELRRLQEDLLKNVATKYKLDSDKLIDEFIPHSSQLEIIPDNKLAIKVQRINNTRSVSNNDQRCMARIWNRGKGGQCTRIRTKNCDLCTQHTNNLKHGRFDQEVNRDIFVKKSTVLYK